MLYLSVYLRNLETYKYTASSGAVRDEEIIAVKADLHALDEMALHGESNDELRLNLLNDIRSLPTWQAMVDETIKGVYKTMDDRYQSVMESTGIYTFHHHLRIFYLLSQMHRTLMLKRISLLQNPHRYMKDETV